MNMVDEFDLSQIDHHPVIEQMVDVLCNRVQNTDRGFFRVEVAYYLAKMAACMRAVMLTKDRGDIPVNVYVLALATSGFGKGHSIHIIENDFLAGFKRRFLEDTFPTKADEHLYRMAVDRAMISGKPEDDEKQKLDKEFRQAGAYAFTFDSGTAPAVKQLRHKLLLADAGSINLQIDEIGSNLVGNVEVLNVFLELYDQGIVKQKLVKNTADNSRGEEIDGKTPTNMLLFGTPSKLLDGGQTEDQLYSFLETGYARRCLFGWGQANEPGETLTAEEVYSRLTQPSNTKTINYLANHFTLLADITKFGWQMDVPDDVSIRLLSYRMRCDALARSYAEHEDIRKAEISHRYFKALKLAGALAFVDESSEVTMDHLMCSIKLVEESGDAFQRLMTREKPYVKLARYIAACKGQELTHADLHESLPFYGRGKSNRSELMTLAQAWGYKQNILIKKNFIDGIEFFSGETLEETNLDKLTLSYSDHFAYNYETVEAPFSELHQLTQAPNLHWCNHGFKGGHRSEENVLAGFNTVVIDVDGGVPLTIVHDLLSEYKFFTYTTKRHTDDENRFRLVLPINYNLSLDQDDYKLFMNAFMNWLPFPTDESANQRSKKWETYDKGIYHLNNGEDTQLIDILRFVPKTTKNEQYMDGVSKLESLDNLERWFAQRMASGSRNNNMIKFALALVDSGMSFPDVETTVLTFNRKLTNGLPEDEIKGTILRTVAQRITS